MTFLLEIVVVPAAIIVQPLAWKFLFSTVRKIISARLQKNLSKF
jgi:hypothetical protein